MKKLGSRETIRLKSLAQIALGSLCLLLVMNVSAASYTLQEGFNAAQNPSGPWSFGWKDSLRGTFNLLNVPRISPAKNGVMIPSWELDITIPGVYANTSKTDTATFGNGGSAGPGTVWFCAGFDGYPQNYCVIRFTTPAGENGMFTMETAVSPMYTTGQSDSDFHVLVDGTEIYRKFLGAEESGGITNRILLRPGTTVDFVIGRGADEHVFASVLKIAAAFSNGRPATSAPPVVRFPAGSTPARGREVQSDVVADFSTASNPSGAWSYGWKSSATGDFTLLTTPRVSYSENSLPVPSWQLNAGPPAVYINTNNQAVTFGGGTGHVAPDSVWFHPGDEATAQTFGAIRFTVPEERAGTYLIRTAVSPVYTVPTQGDTDFHVVINGEEVFVRALEGTNTAAYEGQFTLQAGDTVDFLIGRGVDENDYGDGLIIMAQANPLQFPTSRVIILTQPRDETAMVGADVLFSVGAKGTPPLRYQWYFNNQVLPGETNDHLWLSGVGTNRSGEYHVRVANKFSAVDSSAATLLVLPLPPPATNAFTAFSPAENPSRSWSFGWKETFDGEFQLLTVPYTSPSENGLSIPSWQFTGGLPAVYINTNAQTAVFGVGAGHAPSNSLWYYAGNDGSDQNLGAIRFTVPPEAGGTYQISVSVGPVYTEEEQGDTDFHVVINGEETFGVNLGATGTATYTNQFTLTPGSTVDFLIGRGEDSSVAGSGLVIHAAVQPVASSRPEPSRKPRKR